MDFVKKVWNRDYAHNQTILAYKASNDLIYGVVFMTSWVKANITGNDSIIKAVREADDECKAVVKSFSLLKKRFKLTAKTSETVEKPTLKTMSVLHTIECSRYLESIGRGDFCSRVLGDIIDIHNVTNGSIVDVYLDEDLYGRNPTFFNELVEFFDIFNLFENPTKFYFYW